MESHLIFLTLIILFLRHMLLNLKAKTGFNLDRNKLRNGLEWIFQLDNSYLSTTILNYAVPFYSETEWNDQMIEYLFTAMMLLRYFRRRSSVVPYRDTDVSHRRFSPHRDSRRVVSLRRERVLDNLAAGLYNALLRDRFQFVVRTWRNHHCMFCRTIYRNITRCVTLAQIRHLLQLTIPDGMEGQSHTEEHIHQLQMSNQGPHNYGSQETRMRNLCISTERMTLLFPHNRFHDNRPVTLESQPFFVRGLRLCLRVYPYGIGDGHGSHMSIFLALADTHSLTCNDWRFPLTIRVTLIANQRRYINTAYTIVVRNPRRWCISQPSNINEFGFEMFVPHQHLEHYFVRDGMIILMIELDD